ncbi:outer membrane beta-barrel protein [Pedobacter cryoconitis]|uniref:Carboxypeptidase-like protein n=1 Tax=Pedobacter cryoconitis TaxID=188932 RepID=A0A327S5S4_9SPHI|nr:outer membrane beta-barrel protein [Pedobacter cryoconitis]RAJ24329.1 carboxypeptidase-like protein [Pedobacter cryoconitis]
MKIYTAIFLVIFLNGVLLSSVNAQSGIHVRGVVQDTTNVGIPGVNVRLITGKDTLSSNTDTTGGFGFSNVRSGNITLLIRGIGYYAYSKVFTLKDGLPDQNLPTLFLKSSALQLNEVVIKAKVVPMRVMKDTVEFNADAYAVHENDKVEDLLRQLPGVELDKDGNVSSAGKTLTKIRVNGKDFFTGNVKEFISKLPAGTVSKIQFIDDYGDKANFTGIKTGEPQKILNLVLKSDRNNGNFGSATVSAGTDKRYGLNLNDYLWRDLRQIGVNAIAGNTNTGAGINTNSNMGFSYRDKVKEKLVFSSNYNYVYNKNESIQQSLIETVNPQGIIYDQSANTNSSKSNGHNLDLSLESTDQDNYIRGGFRGALQGTNSTSINESIQTGVIRRDLNTQRIGKQHNPNLNADFSMARKLKKPGRLFSIGIYGSSGLTANNSDLDNQIRYYDPKTGVAVKDSLLDQLVEDRNRTTSLTANFTFTEPLNKEKDSLVKRSLDFSYFFSLNHTRNSLDTKDRDQSGNIRDIDSLSNSYTSSFSKHIIGVNYRYETKKLNYVLGVTGQPSLLTGAYDGRTDRVYRAGFNFSPIARLNYMVSTKNQFNVFYTGNSVEPNFNQLQPVRDTRNLNNIVIGNPDLKAAFNHLINLNYNHSNPQNGSNLQVGIRGSVTQNQVVSNTLLIPDKLAPDSLKNFNQETHYLNTNGNYNFGSNYYWALPFGKRKYTFELIGGINYMHRVSFAEEMKNIGQGVNINQRAELRMYRKWIMLNTGVNYNYNSNKYSIGGFNSNTLQIWTFNMDSRIFILKSLMFGVNAGKTLNEGFSVGATNPLIINGFIEKTFFKNKRAVVKLEGNDFLNQGNNLTRSITDNTTTESRTNQITRYFLLSFTWNLQSFGG